MSISIYNPYFYIIQHIQTGKYYAGVKYAKDSNPNQLLKPNGYKTSSNIIKQIILEEGLESFIIRKIKVFDVGEEALYYESRFLKRVNAAFNNNFLNRSNSSLSTLNSDWEKRKQTCLKKFGCEFASQSEEVKEKKKQTCLENRGVEYSMQSEEVKEKTKQTNLDNLGVEYPMQSEEVREKHKQACLNNLGVEYPSQSEAVKEKKKQTNLDNRGVENPMQSPEVKEKVRQTHNNLMNRPIVLEIRKYRDRFKLKLGRSWLLKGQEFLDNMFMELKITYGDLKYYDKPEIRQIIITSIKELNNSEQW